MVKVCPFNFGTGYLINKSKVYSRIQSTANKAQFRSVHPVVAPIKSDNGFFSIASTSIGSSVPISIISNSNRNSSGGHRKFEPALLSLFQPSIHVRQRELEFRPACTSNFRSVLGTYLPRSLFLSLSRTACSTCRLPRWRSKCSHWGTSRCHNLEK